MPPSLQEWLPEGDLAWFILDVVEQMDLREFYGVYREDGWGAAAYDPGMMVGVLLFAYCQGVRSSRRIAWALERDIGFRVVAANQQPDFRTICRFRAEREEALERLFVQVLRLCREAGLVKLGVVALDGTKVAADAALAANRSYKTIEEEVRRMLAEAKQVDAEEALLFGPEGRGDELPQELGRRGERLSRLGEAKARLEEECGSGSPGAPGAAARGGGGPGSEEAGTEAQGGGAYSPRGGQSQCNGPGQRGQQRTLYHQLRRLGTKFAITSIRLFNCPPQTGSLGPLPSKLGGG